MDLVSIQPRRHTFSTRRTINPHALFSFTTGWPCPHSCLGGEQSTCRCALDDLDHAFATRCVFVVSKRRPNRSAPSWFRASGLQRRIFATYSNRRPRTGRIPAARVRRRTSALSSARQTVPRASAARPPPRPGWCSDGSSVACVSRTEDSSGTAPLLCTFLWYFWLLAATTRLETVMSLQDHDDVCSNHTMRTRSSTLTRGLVQIHLPSLPLAGPRTASDTPRSGQTHPRPFSQSACRDGRATVEERDANLKRLPIERE